MPGVWSQNYESGGVGEQCVKVKQSRNEVLSPNSQVGKSDASAGGLAISIEANECCVCTNKEASRPLYPRSP